MRREEFDQLWALRDKARTQALAARPPTTNSLLPRSFYCAECMFTSHSAPALFHQRTKLGQKEREDRVTMMRQVHAHHAWVPAKAYVCEMCRTDKIMAGVHCVECTLDMCRPCSRRIHAHSTTQHHTQYSI